jgi:1-acyl-sn-glycerol-3-phosphate acyltransferase
MNKLKKNIIKINKKTNIDNNSEDKDALVNSYCSCGDYFRDDHSLVILMPCCHIMHEKCYTECTKKSQIKFLNNNNSNKIKCKLCKIEITHVINEHMLQHGFANKKYKQLKIDLYTVKLNQKQVSINITNLPIGLIKLTSILNKLLGSKSKNDIVSTIDSLFNCMNLKLKIIDNTRINRIKITGDKITWIDDKINKSKMAIISNHSSYLDPIIMYYLFRCGFLTSDFILTTDIGKLIAEQMKLLIFKRNVDTNVVNKMKKYLEDDIDRIGIFPEGLVKTNDTLCRFRTGAFYLGVPVCPIVIKFDKMIFDHDMKTCILKLMTQDVINVKIYVSDLIYPPFNKEKIEKIRNFMCEVGDLKLSRVINKFTKD